LSISDTRNIGLYSQSKPSPQPPGFSRTRKNLVIIFHHHLSFPDPVSFRLPPSFEKRKNPIQNKTTGLNWSGFRWVRRRRRTKCALGTIFVGLPQVNLSTLIIIVVYPGFPTCRMKISSEQIRLVPLILSIAHYFRDLAIHLPQSASGHEKTSAGILNAAEAGERISRATIGRKYYRSQIINIHNPVSIHGKFRYLSRGCLPPSICLLDRASALDNWNREYDNWTAKS
jgi:hypothetical protein